MHDTLQLGLLVCSHSRTLLSLLMASSAFEVSSDYLLDSVIIKYSEQGSNRRTVEEAIIENWTDYVIECGGKYMCACTYIHINAGIMYN